nr:hypothetical protein [Tanacetum cinerariifolium]
MLNKENYVPWSSRLLRYAKSRPNGKLIHNSIINGPYIEADDQAIQTILLDLPEDIYAAVDRCETAQEIWLRYNQKEVDKLKAERLAKIHDPLALIANFNNPYAFPAPHQDQPSFNQNYMQQPMPNPKDITNPTTAMNMALTLMAKAFRLNYSTPTNNNQRISSNLHNKQIAQPECRESEWVQCSTECRESGCSESKSSESRAEGNAARHNGNQIRFYNCRRVGHFARDCTVRPRRKDAAYLQTQLLIAQKEEAGIQLQAEEYDLMVATSDLDEIKEVNANCILMANLRQASTSGTQTDKASVYDSDGSAEVHENCDDNGIFNMFTQEEQYTELLEPIPEQHQVTQNDINIISEVTSVEQSGKTVEQHPGNFEETRALYDSLYHNLAIKVEKVNSVNRKLDFKSLTNEADESLAKHKALELEIERLLKAIVSQDIISVVQKESAVDTSDLQTELKRTKERFENFIIKKENEYAKLWNDWSNKKNDRVPSESKSSRSKNKEAEVEEHHRNLLLSKNNKHMSSACNNLKLDSQNDYSKVVCAMCKKFLISINHDVCLRNYVNGKNSYGMKHKANVSIKEKQKKHQPEIKKTKKVGFLKRLATPKSSKPRSFLRWSPTGRLFDQKGKIIASSDSEGQFDCPNGDNACTPNPLEPTIKRFPKSTFSLAGNSTMFMVRRLGLFQAHDRKSKASHQFRLEVYGNCSLQK